MRIVLVMCALLTLAACSQASASRVDNRTFQIQSPDIGMITDGPNRRLAARVCPEGYRVLDSESHKGGPDHAAADPTSGTTTTWTIRCI